MPTAPIPAGNHRFPKQERITNKRAFTYLFEHGSSMRVGVLKIFFVFEVPAELRKAHTSVAFAVPKRSFKRAVDRNYLKRRLKEAYRLHRHILTPELRASGGLILFSFYTRKKVPYERIRRSMVKSLHLIVEQSATETE
ncbi:MAG: ribonuclease P protein component [Bacteroidota bacterium]